MTDVNGTLYFTMTDTVHGGELWKSDGNTATYIANVGLPDIPNVVISSGNPSDFVAFNGKVYFFANSDHGTELYKTDGTANGTVRVTDINSNSSQLSGYSIFAPTQLVAYENSLYFKAYNGNDHELYRLDTSDVAHKIRQSRTELACQGRR
jgi:ELWxxDGT repeat protein